MLSIGYFPSDWKCVMVTMVGKKGKDLSHSKNWRPISVLPCIGKLYESIIKICFEKNCTSEDHNHSQAGYKPGRSCQEHLVRLTQRIHEAFKSGECVAAAFLDVQSAFDKVWSQGVYYKLLKSGLPIYIIRIIACFLRHRTLLVKQGQHYSEEVLMEAGTPQGHSDSRIANLRHEAKK